MHLTFGEPCSNTLSGRESNFKTDQVLRSRTRLRLANISDPSRAKAAFQASRKRVIPPKTAKNQWISCHDLVGQEADFVLISFRSAAVASNGFVVNWSFMAISRARPVGCDGGRF